MKPRTYRGRLLPRQDDELVDQGLGFDVTTLLSRRRALAFVGIGTAGVALAACGDGTDGAAATTAKGSSAATRPSSASASPSSTTTSASATKEIPDETAGPYPGDGSNGPDALEQSGIVRSDIRSSFGDASATADGVPMTLELTISDLANDGVPFEGVAVYVWHCDRSGEYSLYGQSIADENYLRGVQVADRDGKVRFTSIFPACYAGRWPHIHFEVYPDKQKITDSGKAIATSQVALPKHICTTVYQQDGYEQSVTNLRQVSLSSDNVFGDDNGARQLATVSGSVKKGYHVSLAVGVDTGTKPTGGAAPPGGGPGGPPPA